MHSHISRLAIAIRFALVAVLVLAGSSAALAQIKLRVGKAQAQTFSFVPVDVGVQAGIFKKHGVDVEILNFGGSARLQQALAADAIDIGLGSGPELVFIAKGAPVLGVAAMANTPWVVDLVVLKDGAVKTVADLKGRLVSVSGAQSLTEWLAQELSRQQGWGRDGIRTVGLGTMGAQTAALKTHQIDGMVVESSTAYKLEEEGSGRILVQFGKIISDYHTHVIFARRDLIEKNAPAVRAFLAGWFETIAYMRTHRDETVRIAAQVSDVSPAIAGRNYDELMPMYNDTGRFDPKALAVLARSYVEMGSLPSEPDMHKLFTEDLLPPTK